MSLQPKMVEYVLIDDDASIHEAWNVVAKMEGRHLEQFYQPEEFFNRIKEINPDAQIYIDSQLANGIRGEQVAKQIYDLGYQTIYLSTSSGHSEFPSMPWIKDVVGKRPPFMKS